MPVGTLPLRGAFVNVAYQDSSILANHGQELGLASARFRNYSPPIGTKISGSDCLKWRWHRGPAGRAKPAASGLGWRSPPNGMSIVDIDVLEAIREGDKI